MEERNTINALATASDELVHQISACRAAADRCLAEAWYTDDRQTRCEGALIDKARSLMEVAVELAGALSQLRGEGNMHRQHIRVERVEVSAGEGGGGDSGKQLDAVTDAPTATS